MFVVIEGIEGSGKSTLLGALTESLRGDGHDVVMTREPGGTQFGDAIRALFLTRNLAIEPVAEALLVNASRAQHVEDVIRPALKAGRIVLCDRFVESTLAYQGYGRGLDLGKLGTICEMATDGLEPDLVLLVDMPVEEARSRLQERDEAADRIEGEGNAFHERVRQGFLALAKTPRHCILDGTRSPDEILDDALREVRARLRVRVR